MKKVGLFVVKLGVAAGLVFWLIKQKRLDFAVLNNIQYDVTALLLFVTGAFFVFGALLLLGYRLWLLISFKNFSVSYTRILCITFMGTFWSVILPGLLGGDAVKAIYLCYNVSERRIDALASILIDRFLGLYSLLLLGTLTLFFAWAINALPFDPTILLIAPITVIIVGAGMLLIAWDNFFNSKAVKGMFVYVPKRIQNLLISLREYLKKPKLVIGVIFLSLCGHIFVVGSFIMAAMLLQDTIPIFTHFIINPLAMVMNMLPLTPGGVGLAEGAFSYLFEAAGSSNGAIIGLLGRFIQYAIYISTGSIAMLVLKTRNKIIFLKNKS